MRFVLLMAAVLALGACTYAKPMNDVLVAAEQLALMYDGDITELIMSVNLSEDEAKTVHNSLQTATRVRANFEKYKNNPQIMPVNLLEIEYGRLSNAYKAVRVVALNHRAEYDPGVWYTFEIFDVYARTLDESFSEMVESSRLNEAVINTLYLANSIIRIAALI